MVFPLSPRRPHGRVGGGPGTGSQVAAVTVQLSGNVDGYRTPVLPTVGRQRAFCRLVLVFLRASLLIGNITPRLCDGRRGSVLLRSARFLATTSRRARQHA